MTTEGDLQALVAKPHPLSLCPQQSYVDHDGTELRRLRLNARDNCGRDTEYVLGLK